MKTQRGFTLAPQIMAYGAIAAGVVILTLSGLLWFYIERLDALQIKHAEFVASVKVLGDAAEATRKETEAKHTKQLKETKNAYAKNVDSARSNAVANFLRLYPGRCALPGATVDPKRTDGASQEPLACTKGFVEDSADDATKIKSFQDWARGIGFPVK